MKLCPKNKINDTRLLKGIKLNFISQPDAVYNGASFDLSDYAYNSQSLMQNTLLNTYIKKGSDVLNPDRGTNLLEDSWKQYAFNEEELYHIGNFSAVESKEYINNDIYINDIIHFISIVLCLEQKENGLTDQYYIELEKGLAEICEYETPELGEKMYSAKYAYNGLEYFLIGTIEKEDFEFLLINLRFFY